ncbi:unnamed protein product, partial [marine sediment metagenome]
GFFWEESDGYKIDAAWEAERAIPARVYIMDKNKDKEFDKPGEIYGNSREHNTGSA